MVVVVVVAGVAGVVVVVALLATPNIVAVEEAVGARVVGGGRGGRLTVEDRAAAWSPASDDWAPWPHLP